MPYDPNFPETEAELVSANFRSQFTGLKEEIDAVPTVNAAQVDGVTPLPPGSAPTAAAVVVGNTLHLSFALPLGIDGALVDATNAVGPNDPASATLTLLGTVLHFTFSIPRGQDGTPGTPGEVTNAALGAAIAGTSGNSNAVGTLDTPFADPDAEALRGKMNEMLLALRR